MPTKNFNPFLFYSKQLQELFIKASKQKNPALWLYENGVRSKLFMLEALTRLHNKAFDEKLFDKWNKRFKKLEDIFGLIDEYIVLESEFKKNKKVPKDSIKYFTVNANKYLEKCNQRLTEKDWLTTKMNSFDFKLSEFNVEYNKEYIDELKFAIVDEIDAILDFTLKADYKFTKLEEQVHEIRRKLRWISIYGQALQGLVQLKNSTKKQKTELAYLTKEVISSKYNQLPGRPKNTAIIEFDANSFYALSWLINELGTLKDSGIKLMQLKDAIYVSENITEEEAERKAVSSLGFKKTLQEDVLKQASEIIKTALTKDKILDRLIIA